MSDISENKLLGLIGNTPILKLSKIAPANSASIFAKLEMFNPGGSVKDRAAMSMISDAEKCGVLKPGGTIIEPTSGNTGIGLAMIAAIKGYRCVLVMPECMSVERRKILSAYGAEIFLTNAGEWIPGAIRKAKELLSEIPNSWMPSQFENPANPQIHERTTGPEILSQMENRIAVFVAGIGTGGTISGVGKFLKSVLPEIKIIGIEPAESAVISGKQPGSHGIQGLGAGFVPKNLDMSVIDEIISIPTEEAKEHARLLAKKEGIFAGISSGAALAGAMKIAEKLGVGKNVVTLFPDSGEKYISTGLWD